MDLKLFLPETVLCGAILLHLCLALAKNAVGTRVLTRVAVMSAAALAPSLGENALRS